MVKTLSVFSHWFITTLKFLNNLCKLLKYSIKLTRGHTIFLPLSLIISQFTLILKLITVGTAQCKFAMLSISL